MMTRQAAQDPDFRDGGDGGGVLRCQSQRGVRGPPTYYLANFAENYMKMKKLDRRGACPKFYYTSATLLVLQAGHG